MRITSKGQVTIPQDVRERAGLLPNTEVEFVYDGTTVRLVKSNRQKASRGAQLVARMRGRGSVKMTTDQIMSLTRSR